MLESRPEDASHTWNQMTEWKGSFVLSLKCSNQFIGFPHGCWSYYNSGRWKKLFFHNFQYLMNDHHQFGLKLDQMKKGNEKATFPSIIIFLPWLPTLHKLSQRVNQSSQYPTWTMFATGGGTKKFRFGWVVFLKTSQELRMLSPSLFIQGSQCKC